MSRTLPFLALLVGCISQREAEDPSEWFDKGSALDVTEALTFTDQSYDFPANPNDGIGWLKDHVFPVEGSGFGSDTVAWGPDDATNRDITCANVSDPALPFDIEGVATAHPRFYFKTTGCTWDSDEKYYGSFFIQDATGGVFVLGDSKLAHFDMGDRVRIRARAAKTSFDLDMIYAFDLVEVVERNVPIYYEEPTAPFVDLWEAGDDPTGRVWRVTGEVVTRTDTFGEFQVEDDEGRRFHASLDMEINRRGIEFPVGSRVTITGPVLYSYSIFAIVITRKGQVTVHD